MFLQVFHSWKLSSIHGWQSLWHAGESATVSLGSYTSEKQTVGSCWQGTAQSCSHRTSVHNQLVANEVHKMEEKKKDQNHVMSHNNVLSAWNTSTNLLAGKRKTTQEKHPKLIYQQKTSEDHVFTVVSKWKARFIVSAFTEVFTKKQ